MFDDWNIEINEIAQSFSCQSQIAQKLRLVYQIHYIYCFQFTNHKIRDQNIQPESGIQLHTIINDGNRHLLLCY